MRILTLELSIHCIKNISRQFPRFARNRDFDQHLPYTSQLPTICTLSKNQVESMPVPYYALTILALIIPFFLLDLGNNPNSPLSQLNNPVHIVFFALLALALTNILKFRRLQFARQSLLIIIIAGGLGGMIELLQPFFARTASWRDMGINMLGALAGLYLLAERPKIQKIYLLKGVQIFVIAGLSYFLLLEPVATIWDMNSAKRQFPILGDFESQFESWRWTNGKRDRSLARHGKASLRVQLGSELYPGTTLLRSFGNWESHNSFGISIYNPEIHSINITISIRDSQHDKNRKGFGDRYDETFAIYSGWNDIIIPLDKISNAPKERKLSLNKISSIVIFCTQRKTMYFNIDHVRIIK